MYMQQSRHMHATVEQEGAQHNQTMQFVTLGSAKSLGSAYMPCVSVRDHGSLSPSNVYMYGVRHESGLKLYLATTMVNLRHMWCVISLVSLST